MIEAATAEVKSLGNCCKDSDNVLDKINALHEKLSGQGEKERENELSRQCQKLRTMYERAKNLAEKESEACLECLAKIDQLIFSKTGETMPQPAENLRKRVEPMDLPAPNGAPPAKRQSVDPLGSDVFSTPGGAAPVPRMPKPTPTPKPSAREKQEAARRKQEEKERLINAENALFEAAKTNNVEKALKAINEGADVNKALSQGAPALHFASSQKCPEVARLLLQRGAEVNKTGAKLGWTALIWACSMNSVSVVKVLLEFGVDVNLAGSKDGSTPLGWCAFKDSLEVAEVLLEAGADINAKGLKDGNTALHWASQKNSCRVARLLLKKGARTDITNGENWTPAKLPTAGQHVLEILEGRDPGEQQDPPRPEFKDDTPVVGSIPSDAEVQAPRPAVGTGVKEGGSAATPADGDGDSDKAGEVHATSEGSSEAAAGSAAQASTAAGAAAGGARSSDGDAAERGGAGGGDVDMTEVGKESEAQSASGAQEKSQEGRAASSSGNDDAESGEDAPAGDRGGAPSHGGKTTGGKTTGGKTTGGKALARREQPASAGGEEGDSDEDSDDDDSPQGSGEPAAAPVAPTRATDQDDSDEDDDDSEDN